RRVQATVRRPRRPTLSEGPGRVSPEWGDPRGRIQRISSTRSLGGRRLQQAFRRRRKRSDPLPAAKRRNGKQGLRDLVREGEGAAAAAPGTAAIVGKGRASSREPARSGGNTVHAGAAPPTGPQGPCPTGYAPHGVVPG